MSNIREFYDDDAAEYDEKRFSEDDWQRETHQRLLQGFLSNIPVESHILEIGCGTGRFTATLVETGFDTTAVDISHSMLRETRQRCIRKNTKTRPTLLNGDVSQLPFDDNQFDACVMINVASHLPEPEASFSEIARVVSEDGNVFANFTNLLSPYLPVGIIVNLRGQSVQEDVYSNWYSWGEINNVLSQAGLEAERIRGHMIPPRGEYPFMDTIVKKMDELSRDSAFRFVAGNRFYHLRVARR